MRWIVQDPATGTSYTFPLNPNKMTSPLPTKATANVAAPRSWGFGGINPIGPRTKNVNPEPVSWQFEGFAHDAAMLTTLKNIFNIKGRFYLTDHYARCFVTRLTSVDVDERVPTFKNPSRFAYVARAISYGQIL